VGGGWERGRRRERENRFWNLEFWVQVFTTLGKTNLSKLSFLHLQMGDVTASIHQGLNYIERVNLTF
jgi:hypothetical protein